MEVDQYDVLAEQKKKKKEKKRELKDLAEMSKDIMSSKNRKLLKTLEFSKRKDRTENARLESKSKSKPHSK